jgi:Ca-activated chloride channel family protein
LLDLVHPWLLALLPLPLLVRWFVPAYRESRSAVQVSFLPLIARLTGQQPASGSAVARGGIVRTILLGIAWAALVLALVRPQWLEDPLSQDIPMRDMLVAVDLSGSMETRDFTGSDGQQVDRLTAAKEVLDGFLAQREDDRIGLIVFGNAAFVQAPFTNDLDVIRTLLDEVEPRMAGPRTAFGDAIGLAITLFDRSDIDERVLIVLTDGNDTGSLIPPDQAAGIASDNDIVIYTVGMGDPENAGEAPLDEATLRKVADVTGGQYFYAADRESLEDVYAELDRLTPRNVETLTHRPRRDLFQWPLGLALALSLVYHFMQLGAGLFRHRSRPKNPVVEQS